MLKNSAFVTLTSRTSPDDWRTKSRDPVLESAISVMSCPPSGTVGQFYHTPQSAPVVPVLRRLPFDTPGVPAHEAVLGDRRGDAFEELPVILAERAGLVGVDVDLSDDERVVDDRHDDLGSCREEAREVAVVGVHVVDDLGAAAGRRRAADPLADRDAHVLGGLRPAPGPEHELVALDEVDPDPGVRVEAVVEQVDDPAQDVVGVLAAGGDLLDLGEHRGAHDSTAVSKAATAPRMPSSTRTGRRSAT